MYPTACFDRSVFGQEICINFVLQYIPTEYRQAQFFLILPEMCMKIKVLGKKYSLVYVAGAIQTFANLFTKTTTSFMICIKIFMKLTTCFKDT